MDSGKEGLSARGDSLELRGVTTHHIGPVDWRVDGGSCVALGGESGSGKSLLLRAIADLDPHGGEVRLNGVASGEMSGHLWRRRVGLLPAESAWWTDRVGDHFGADDPRLLERLDLAPEALEWSVARCSTGERQRLALARLLLNRPSVLLLDEPTASLDRENIGRVEALIDDYRREWRVTVVWVSHDPEQSARVASRRYRLEGGRLQEEAP